MDNLILDPLISEMLTKMGNVFSAFGIDYYIVGAVARDIHLTADFGHAAIRKTKDVDLAILINDATQFNELKVAFVATGDFTVHPTEAIKIIYRNALEVDLLPFGDIEGADRNVNLVNPSFVLNMPGFREIYPFVNEIHVADGFTIKVCTMEGIILLKLISNNDRPERTKDISDIEHIIRVYFDLYSGDIYEEHFDLMDLYDMNDREYIQLVCSHVIGRKMKHLLSNSAQLQTKIKQTLAIRPTRWWQAMLAGIND